MSDKRARSGAQRRVRASGGQRRVSGERAARRRRGGAGEDPEAPPSSSGNLLWLGVGGVALAAIVALALIDTSPAKEGPETVDLSSKQGSHARGVEVPDEPRVTRKPRTTGGGGSDDHLDYDMIRQAFEDFLSCHDYVAAMRVLESLPASKARRELEIKARLQRDREVADFLELAEQAHLDGDRDTALSKLKVVQFFHPTSLELKEKALEFGLSDALGLPK